MVGKKTSKAEPYKREQRRAQAKPSHKAALTGKKRAKRAAAPKVAQQSSRAASLEVRLRKTVAELGLTEARKIFASVEAAFSETAPPSGD